MSKGNSKNEKYGREMGTIHTKLDFISEKVEKIDTKQDDMGKRLILSSERIDTHIANHKAEEFKVYKASGAIGGAVGGFIAGFFTVGAWIFEKLQGR